MRTMTKEPGQWHDAFLQNVQTVPVAYPVSYSKDKGVLSGAKTAGA